MPQIVIRSLAFLALACAGLGQIVPIDSIQYSIDPSGDSRYDGQLVNTTGLVTAVTPRGFTTRYYISSPNGGPWSGILVNDFQNRQLLIGDSVYLTATVDEASGQTRLASPITNFFSTPSGRLVSPYPAQSGSIDEAEEGVFIEILEGIVVSVNSDTSFVINDGSGPLLVGRLWPGSYYPAVDDTLRYLRGIVAFSNSEFSVNPRNDADYGFFGNRPPSISSVQRFPDSPTNLETDTVVATIFDDTAVLSAVVYYRFGTSGEFIGLQMVDDGTHRDGNPGDGVYGAILPAGPARATCYYYVWANDAEGEFSTSPADAPEETYSYIVRSSTLSVFDLQYTGSPTGGASPYANQNVTVTGIVTATNFGELRTNFYLSDPGGGAWSGIFVFSPSITPALGDCVRVSGGIVEFNGITEFSTNVQVTLLGTGTVPDPIDVPLSIIADSAEAYEGVLIRVGACTVTNIDEWVPGFPAFRVNDEHGNPAFVVGEAEFEYEPFVGDEFISITGCLDYYSGHGWEIAPRFDADLNIIDVRAPMVAGAASVGERLVNVTLNERLSSSGLDDPANYTLVNLSLPEFPELHIERAGLFSTGRVIHLETLEELADSHSYRITIHEVSDVAGNRAQDLTSAFAGYSAREFTPIRDLYDRYDYYQDSVGTVTLRGVVTHMQDVTTSSGSRRISAYIQDGSGRGFALSESGPASGFPGIRRGNLIEISGVVGQFTNAIQLNGFNGDPASGDVRVVAENQPLPQPIMVRTGDYRAQRQIVQTSHTGYLGSGTWVVATGTVYRVDQNVGGGTNIYFDDGSGSTVIRVWDAMQLHEIVLNGRTYRLDELVGLTMSIAGVSSTFDGDFQMLAGYAEDFTTDLPNVLPSEGLTLDIINSPTGTGPIGNRPFAPDLGQTLSIFYNTPAQASVRLRLFDLRGHLVYTFIDKPAGGPNRINWNGRDDLNNLLPMGTYLLHLEAVKNGDTDSKVKPIVIGTKL